MATPDIVPAKVNRVCVECHVCSSLDHGLYLEARGYRIVQCRNCGLWFVNPQPTEEELRQFYATYDDGEQWRKLEDNFNRSIRSAILQRKPAGAVLDVGCGSGNFLSCMKESGFSVFGIEPSGSGSEYAVTAHGVGIFRGMIDDYLATSPGVRFDVITLLNVLEHLPNPVRTLLQLRQMLTADGILIIVVPDARFHDLVGRMRRRMGLSDPYWIEQPNNILSGFKLPDHLCSFQPASLASLLRRCSFSVIDLQNAPIVLNADLKRNLGKLLVRWTAQIVHNLTFRRFLIGYSTLAVAQRASD